MFTEMSKKTGTMTLLLHLLFSYHEVMKLFPIKIFLKTCLNLYFLLVNSTLP